MRLFNVYKILYLIKKSKFIFHFFFWFKCNQSCSQDIVHVQLWKILELKKEKKKEKKDKIEIYFNCCPGWHIQWQR